MLFCFYCSFIVQSYFVLTISNYAYRQQLTGKKMFKKLLIYMCVSGA